MGGVEFRGDGCRLFWTAGLATDARGFTRIPDDREMLRGMVCRLDAVYTLRVRKKEVTLWEGGELLAGT